MGASAAPAVLKPSPQPSPPPLPSLDREALNPASTPPARPLEDDLVLASKALPAAKPNSNGEGPERPDVDPPPPTRPLDDDNNSLSGEGAEGGGVEKGEREEAGAENGHGDEGATRRRRKKKKRRSGGGDDGRPQRRNGRSDRGGHKGGRRRPNQRLTVKIRDLGAGPRLAHQTVMLASIEPDALSSGGNDDGDGGDLAASPSRVSSLPYNQYETVLRRRAVIKVEDDAVEGSRVTRGGVASTRNAGGGVGGTVEGGGEPHGVVAERKRHEARLNVDDELVGDTSLGMKLTMQHGHVIVEAVMPLTDGRASPAQQTGMIRRGDVLVAIDGRSLLHLTPANFNDAMKPLSSAESPLHPRRGGGLLVGSPIDNRPRYRRELRLCFAIGEGLPILDRKKWRGGSAGSDTAAKIGTDDSQRDLASDMVEMFLLNQLMPTADSPSGQPPPVEDKKKLETENIVLNNEGKVMKEEGEGLLAIPSMESALSDVRSKLTLRAFSSTRVTVRLNQEIAIDITLQRQWDKVRHTSKFFSMEERFSPLLRSTSSPHLIADLGTSYHRHNLIRTDFVTRREMVERGRSALSGARILFNEMEACLNRSQKGPEAVSLSRRSSLRSSRPGSVPASDVDSDGSSILTGELGDLMDGRDFGNSRSLLKHAAYDVEWRDRVISALRGASIGDSSDGEGDMTPRKQTTRASEDRLENVEANLVPVAHSRGSTFLGGGNDAIESQLQNLLFGEVVSHMMQKKKSLALPPADLTELLFDLATHVTVAMPDQINLSSTARANNVQEKRSTRPSNEATAASQFLLEDALPAWLATFRPLRWSQRRVLWPLHQTGGGVAEDLDGDGTDSIGNSSFTSGWGTPNTNKRLQEQIEEMELDAELITET